MYIFYPKTFFSHSQTETLKLWTSRKIKKYKNGSRWLLSSHSFMLHVDHYAACRSCFCSAIYATYGYFVYGCKCHSRIHVYLSLPCSSRTACDIFDNNTRIVVRRIFFVRYLYKKIHKSIDRKQRVYLQYDAVHFFSSACLSSIGYAF